ncbi:MAG: hypothetical protein K1Y36_02455 [Blastocatellia bacterium]|nr:hypothetical protein [Blastocatellia bacterium]
MKSSSLPLRQINLSRDPFRNRRLFWLCWMVGTLIFGGGILRGYENLSQERQLLTQNKSRNEREERKLGELRSKATAIPAQALLTPDQEDTMRSAVTITQKRSFSWSRLMTQLEHSLAKEVRVKSIAFQKGGSRVESTEVTPEAPLPLVLTVRANKTEAVTEFLRALDKQNVFRLELKSQSKSQEQGGNGEYEFELMGSYNPQAADLKPPVNEEKLANVTPAANRPGVPPVKSNGKSAPPAKQKARKSS